MQHARFRLGSTSYVYPGDLLHNARSLAGQVSDIELILFHGAAGSNIPSKASVNLLAEIARANLMTYTVHLPHDLPATDGERADSLRHVQEIVQLFEPLDPYAYVFHITSAHAGSAQWTEGALKTLDALRSLMTDPARWALENLEAYSPQCLEPIFAAHPIQRALDIGHLWKAGIEPLPTLESWLPHTRVIHLHGMKGQDHRSLAVIPPAELDPIVERLLGWSGVVTLEVFEQDFFSSRDALIASIERVCR
jgi:sugar phosphate isomerase/epimerase